MVRSAIASIHFCHIWLISIKVFRSNDYWYEYLCTDFWKQIRKTRYARETLGDDVKGAEMILSHYTRTQWQIQECGGRVVGSFQARTGSVKRVDGWDTPPRKFLIIFAEMLHFAEFLQAINKTILSLSCNNNQTNNCSTKCPKCILHFLLRTPLNYFFHSISACRGFRPNSRNIPWILVGNG